METRDFLHLRWATIYFWQLLIFKCESVSNIKWCFWTLLLHNNSLAGASMCLVGERFYHRWITLSHKYEVRPALMCLMPRVDERLIEERVKGESFSCQWAVVACVGGQDSVCVWAGERKEEAGLLLRMLPAWLLSPPRTLLACCFSKHEGPEMIQVEPTVTTAHPEAKVKTTTFRHT